jgi:hypothetical protein
MGECIFAGGLIVVSPPLLSQKRAEDTFAHPQSGRWSVSPDRLSKHSTVNRFAPAPFSAIKPQSGSPGRRPAPPFHASAQQIVASLGLEGVGDTFDLVARGIVRNIEGRLL